MSRPLPTGFATAAALAQIPAAFLVELDWPDGTVYAWNGYHALSWNGHSWVGVGHLGGIASISESADLAANGLALSLSGIPSAEVAEALRNDTQGCSGRVYFGILSTDGFVIDPYLIFDGLIDAPSIQDDGTTATITVNLEKEMLDDRSAARRYTHADQQIDAPGDTFLQFVASLALQTFTWGKATVFPPTGDDSINDGSTATE